MSSDRPGPAAVPSRVRRAVAFLDLDCTVLHSASTAPAEPVVVLDPVVGSIATPEALRLARRLAAVAVVVPTTTRSIAQYTRLALEPLPWAITSNGGEILRRGVPDPDWSRHVRRQVAGGCAPIDQVTRQVRELAPTMWPTADHVTVVEGLFLVVHLRRPDQRAEHRDDGEPAAPARCTEGADRLGQLGWYVSGVGRKRYVIPDPVRKETAAQHVASAVGAVRVLAAGDSALDVGLLRWADAAVVPRGTAAAATLAVLAGGGTSRDGRTEVTDLGSSPAAGEQVLRRLIRAAAPVSGPAEHPA